MHTDICAYSQLKDAYSCIITCLEHSREGASSITVTNQLNEYCELIFDKDPSPIKVNLLELESTLVLYQNSMHE